MVNSGSDELGFLPYEHEESKLLSNFSLAQLKRGTQKDMTRMTAGSPCNIVAGTTSAEHRVRRPSPSLKIGNSSTPIDVHDFNSKPSTAAHARSEIHKLSENLLKDLRTYATKMKQSIFKEEALFRNDEDMPAASSYKVHRSMVNSDRDERGFMPYEHEEPKLLRNFSFAELKWGKQKYMRCMTAGSPCNSGAGLTSFEHRVRRPSPSLKIGNSSTPIAVHDINSKPSTAAQARSEKIHELSENLLPDLRTYARNMKQTIFKEEALCRNDDGEEETVKEEERRGEKRKRVESPRPAAAPAEDAFPWNLRSRRQTSGSPIVGAGNGNGIGAGNRRGLRIEEKRVDSSSSKKDLARPKFSVSLSKKEIEEDFKTMLGHGPPRRPKKHPKAVQKKLDCIYPGMYLTEVTPDLYKVSEPTDKKKKR